MNMHIGIEVRWFGLQRVASKLVSNVTLVRAARVYNIYYASVRLHCSYKSLKQKKVGTWNDMRPMIGHNVIDQSRVTYSLISVHMRERSLCSLLLTNTEEPIEPTQKWEISIFYYKRSYLSFLSYCKNFPQSFLSAVFKTKEKDAYITYSHTQIVCECVYRGCVLMEFFRGNVYLF